MDFFEAVRNRRSIRQYTADPVPNQVVQKALETALLAPNSSNLQTWNFYWVQSELPKNKLIEACLSQSAARKAQHLIVATADYKLWKRSQPDLITWVQSSKAHPQVLTYYQKLIPWLYRTGFLNILAPIKWLMSFAVGLFRPMMRSPITRRDLEEVAIKSTALACENFVLAISAQGFSSCMMEGFDEARVAKILNLSRTERVVMVISVGKSREDGTWGPQFRIPPEKVIHIV